MSFTKGASSPFDTIYTATHLREFARIAANPVHFIEAYLPNPSDGRKLELWEAQRKMIRRMHKMVNNDDSEQFGLQIQACRQSGKSTLLRT